MRTLPKIQIINPHVQMPERASVGSAGYDLFLPEDVILKAGEQRKVNMGFAMAMNIGVCAMIFPRSGLSTKQGIKLANTVGIIDSDFHGEICLMLKNESNDIVPLSRGQRVAQMIFVNYGIATVTDDDGNIIEDFEIVDDLGDTDRDKIGFGSTGE